MRLHCSIGHASTRVSSSLKSTIARADIVVENMPPDGVPVLVDFGVTHSLLLSYARAAAQRGELDAEGASKRAHAANIYADKKNQRYNRIITERSLDINYRSFIVESFGAFASDTWNSLMPSVIRTHTPKPMTSTIRGTTPTRPALLFSLLALPTSEAMQSC